MNVRRSVIFSLIERHIGFLIQLTSSVIVARLLSPTEIGLYAVAAALLATVYVVREFGVVSFIIQERDLTISKVKTAFGLMILMSWPLAAAIGLGRNSIASAYGYHELGSVLGVLAINFIILPFGQPARGLLQRNLRFKALAVIDVVSAGVHAGTAIGIAWLGYGAMSLAYASVIGTGVTALLTLCAEPQQVRLLPSLAHWREMLRFGVYSTAASIVGTVGSVSAELALGKFLDLAAVGLYSRAAGVVTLLQAQLPMAFSRVALPGFAQMLRDGKHLEQPFLLALSHVTGFLWPAYAFLAFTAEPLITLLFGVQWIEAVPVAQVLCITGALHAVTFLIQNVYVAHGAMKRRLAIEIFLQTVGLMLVIAAAPHGLLAVALIRILSGIIAVFTLYAAIRAYFSIDLSSVLRAVWRSAVVAFTTAIALAVGSIATPWAELADALRLVIACFSGAAGWSVGLWLTRHVLGIELWQISCSFLQRIKSNI